MAQSKTSRREWVRRRRHRRVRQRMSGTAERPRLVVHRSIKNISAQMVDDEAGRVLCGVSTVALDRRGTKVEQARRVGEEIARQGKERGVTAVVFDRGGYLYHGRVQALAEGAREGGLEF